MQRKAKTRYDALTEEQRQYLKSRPAELLLSNRLNSFTGRAKNLEYFREALQSLEALVSHWYSKDDWIRAFIYYWSSPSRNSTRIYSNAVSLFRNGFYEFVEKCEKSEFKLSELTPDFIAEYEIWLKTKVVKIGGRPPKLRSPITSRKQYFIVKSLLIELHRNPRPGIELPPLSIFRVRAFSDAHKGVSSTRVLSDIEWGALVKAVRKDALEIFEQVQSDWKFLEEMSGEIPSYKRGDYANRKNILARLKSYYPSGIIPALHDIRSKDVRLYNALCKHGYKSHTMSFAPSVEALLPFVLLVAIYSIPNTGPLRALKLSKITRISVLNNPRVLWEFVNGVELDEEGGTDSEGYEATRVTFEWEKGRIHGSYVRSFAIDHSDPLSPSSLHEFIERWTSIIRPYAGRYSDHFFIFTNHWRTIRGFFTAEHDGTDTDVSWRQALGSFFKKHKLPRTTVSEIRTTGINRISELFDGDLIAPREAAGHARGSSTIEVVYEGDGAKLKRNELLASVSTTMERFVRSGGRSHVRGAPQPVDAACATPGWGCLDPYNSPIPGQIKGKLCEGFGLCPACALGLLNHESPYCVARAIQLRNEVDEAHNYMNFSRWKAVYEPVRQKLDKVWLPLVSMDVLGKARELNLGPIGRLE